MNRRDRRRAEAQERAHEARLRKDAEEHRQNMERTWATGLIDVVANEFDCFQWIGTRQEAIEVQKRYLDMMNALGIRARSYAKRAAGYLMAYGMPKAGDVDLRPSNHGNRWDQIDIDLYKAAVLWLALREHIPNTGQKLEDVLVGKALLVKFIGDKERILADTERELGGEPLAGGRDVGHVEFGSALPDDQFQMMAAVLDDDYRLDPRLAVSIPFADLAALAGKPPLSGSRIANDLVYVPRMPLDATEADAMLKMMTVFVDAMNPSGGVRTYAGYTDEELRRGKPAVRIR